MRLTYFYSTEIDDSIKLKNQILSLQVLDNFDVTLIDSNSDDFSQLELLIACHRDDIVIVDCSIPDDIAVKTVYPILVAQINMLDHVLVVSKTMLPLNITPQRQGYDSPRFKQDFSDKKQLLWIEEQIKDLHQAISKGTHYKRIPLKGYQDLEKYRLEMELMWDNSHKYNQARNSEKKKVFISYRSNYYDEVFKYKKAYEKKYPDTIVRIVEPGILCSGEETLSPMRKWMLVFMLEEKIHDIQELIIYRTPDYTESWWTCAELVMVAYNNWGRTEENKIKIKYYVPEAEEQEEVNIDNLLMPYNLDKQQKNRLDRLAANTRPDTMGPECMNNIEQMRSICESINNSNFIVSTLLKWSIKRMLKKSIPASLPAQEKKEMLRKTMELYTNPQSLDTYLADDVFKDSFWNRLSYQIEWTTPAFIFDENKMKYTIDIDTFLNAPMQEIIPFTEQELKRKVEQKETIKVYNKDNHKCELSVTLCPTKRYIWLATRMGQPTIKDAPGLEIIQTYNLEKVES